MVILAITAIKRIKEATYKSFEKKDLNKKEYEKIEAHCQKAHEELNKAYNAYWMI